MSLPTVRTMSPLTFPSLLTPQERFQSSKFWQFWQLGTINTTTLLCAVLVLLCLLVHCSSSTEAHIMYALALQLRHHCLSSALSLPSHLCYAICCTATFFISTAMQAECMYSFCHVVCCNFAYLTVHTLLFWLKLLPDLV